MARKKSAKTKTRKTKKTSKKSMTGKKTAKKITKNKAHSHKLKKDAPEAEMFVLCNGKRLKNVKELADVMEELEEHVFNHHVRPDSNDFAKWVKDIFKDVELARKITKAEGKKHIQLVIYKHITHKTW